MSAPAGGSSRYEFDDPGLSAAASGGRARPCPISRRPPQMSKMGAKLPRPQVRGLRPVIVDRSASASAALALLRVYSAFFTKWRGEMPMSSSNARIIGDAPTNWTVFRCASIRLIVLSNVPAQTKSMRSTWLKSIGTTLWDWAYSARRAICDTADPTMTPVQQSDSASVGAGAASAPAGVTGAAGRIGGSHEGGDSSKVTAYSTARPSNAPC